jgi:hypothetical protein
MRGVVVVFRYQVNVAFVTERFPDGLGQLTQNIGVVIILVGQTGQYFAGLGPVVEVRY